MEIIEIAHLTKTFKGRVAVDDLNMIVREGEIYGFVGPNGAGKTTTIRILATLLEPDEGEIWIAGHSVREEPLAVRRMIGYMPDFFGVYNDMQVWEYLDFFAACYAIPEHKRTGMIDDLLELVELTHRKDDMLESLSRGMKQRLSLARTLIHDPKILILDEPASGLDPRARIEIRELLLELAGMGKTIFFSTHILADVAEVCTQVGIIEAGKLVADGPLDHLAQGLASQRSIQIDILSPVPPAQEILARIPGVAAIQVNSLGSGRPEPRRIQFLFTGDDQALSAVLADMVSAGVVILHFTEVLDDLEDVFLQATKGLVT
jgi:ABC-2 type transport system ATP-binding protein